MDQPSCTRVYIRQGRVEGIYHDALQPYLEALRPTKLELRRASHVDPYPTSEGIRWLVNFEPSGGPRRFTDELGRPHVSRDTALAYEVRVLNRVFAGRPWPEAVLGLNLQEGTDARPLAQTLGENPDHDGPADRYHDRGSPGE